LVRFFFREEGAGKAVLRGEGKDHPLAKDLERATNTNQVKGE